MKNKIISSEKDLFGIIFFGTVSWHLHVYNLCVQYVHVFIFMIEFYNTVYVHLYMYLYLWL